MFLTRSWLFVLVVGAVAVVLSGPARAMQTTTIWVDDSGSDSSGTGAETNPYKTINKGSHEASLLSGTKIIKVRPGTYDWSHESSYVDPPFPISLPTSTRVEASDSTNQSTWPKVGGGVPTSSTQSLIVIDAQSAGRTVMQLKNIYFEGEDDSGQDGPSAVKAISRSGYSLSLDIDTCYFERQAQRDGSSTDRPTILLDASYGAFDVEVISSTIYPSDLAGVNIAVGGGTSSSNVAHPDVTVRDCSILLAGTDTASFGIRYLATGETYSNLSDEDVVIKNNVIDSSACTSGYGIATGLKIELTPTGTGIVTLDHDELFITDNTIKSCTAYGIWYLSDAPSTASSHLSTFDFERNDIRGSNGTNDAGINIDWGSQNYGYLQCELRNNVIVDNYFGVWLHGTDLDPSSRLFANNTVAYNSHEGFYVDDSKEPTALTNNIVHGNNGGGTQHGGTSSWSPTSPAYCDYNCWQALYSSPADNCDPTQDPNGKHNVTAAPGFANQGTGDYHLTSSACARNKGDNTPDSGVSIGSFDIDGQRRINAGDSTVDIGADEYH